MSADENNTAWGYLTWGYVLDEPAVEINEKGDVHTKINLKTDGGQVNTVYVRPEKL